MHELSIAQALTELAVDVARRENAAAVRRLVVALGAFSNVEPDALRLAYEMAAAGTICEGATLEFEVEEATAFCVACETTVAIHSRGDPCPRCGDVRLLPRGGDQMRLKELEVI